MNKMYVKFIPPSPPRPSVDTSLTGLIEEKGVSACVQDGEEHKELVLCIWGVDSLFTHRFYAIYYLG